MHIVTSINISTDDNGNGTLSPALALLLPRASCGFSTSSTLSLLGCNSLLLFGLLAPTFMVTKSVSVIASPVFITIAIALHFHNAAQSRASGRQTSHDLLRGRIKELLRAGGSLNCTGHPSNKRVVIPPDLTRFRRIIAGGFALVGCLLVGRLLSPHWWWHRRIVLQGHYSRRWRSWVGLRALSRVGPSHASRWAGRLIMGVFIVLMVAAFRPDPSCKPANSNSTNGDQRHPVAQHRVLSIVGTRAWRWRGRISRAAVVPSGGGGLAVRAIVRHGECRRLHGRQGRQVERRGRGGR